VTALLLLGFAGAFRRSELVALDVADLEETDDGYKITIRRSKTDQEGHGATIAIARGVTTCPVKPSRRGCKPLASAKVHCSAPSPRAAGCVRRVRDEPPP
jgi:hypothetical protein